jgi:hypothetical protein
MQEAAAPRSRPIPGPRKAIDIARRSDIQREIAEDRRQSEQSDLLRSDAPLE